MIWIGEPHSSANFSLQATEMAFSLWTCVGKFKDTTSALRWIIALHIGHRF